MSDVKFRRRDAVQMAVDMIGKERPVEDIVALAAWILDGAAVSATLVEPPRKCPAVGDIVTEEPPVGSILGRAGTGSWYHRHDGWSYGARACTRYGWDHVVSCYPEPLRLVHWSDGDE